MDMTPGSKHNDEHDEAQKKVFRGYGFRPGGINMLNSYHFPLAVHGMNVTPRRNEQWSI